MVSRTRQWDALARDPMLLTIVVIALATVGTIAMLVSAGFVMKAFREHPDLSLASRRLSSEIRVVACCFAGLPLIAYAFAESGIAGAVWALIGFAALFVVLVPLSYLARKTASWVEHRLGRGRRPADTNAPRSEGAQAVPARVARHKSPSLLAILRRTRSDLRAELTPAERAAWWAFAGLKLLAPPAVVGLVLAREHISSTAIAGLLIGTLIVYAVPTTAMIYARARRRRERAADHACRDRFPLRDDLGAE